MSCCGNNPNGCCKTKSQGQGQGQGQPKPGVSYAAAAAAASAGETQPAATTQNASVPLLRKNNNNKGDDNRPKSYGAVWTVDSTVPSQSQSQSQGSREQQLIEVLGDDQPLGSKCSAHESGGQCCKDLKGEDERHLISPEIVRDVIIGLSDGLTVPFALTAGLSSLGSSSLVVTGGLAELCAGAISMGLGGYLASQAELDHFLYLRRHTHARVLRSCAGEMEREVHSILGPLGVKEQLSRLIAEDLRVIEDDLYVPGMERTTSAEGIVTGDGGVGIARAASPSRKKGWGRLLGWKKGAPEEEEGGQSANEDMGLTAFLLKFGEGMEEVPKSRLYISALTIGLSYFIGGLIPLIPYMLTSNAEDGLILSSIITCVILFIFGGFKTYFTGAEGGWRGYAYGAISTTIVGGFAAGAAFGLVKVLGIKE
ncbi:vacuolar iron transporter 1.1 [Kwoniella shandongensis]|uniref:Vacuolar iron transporter 1.1 n=1 Tax=Kwoniella shandongensis TaxID=1734106 RepID=A0A5M6C690_9TREE|nr:vacuolar iron transporter 1.1 [Kwoniella shandongensis]KAA5530543.1 vacuolar iron transporter 1.1 [Kwoniella shandongensis]